jgi:uncharacterized protein YodC (DUF2158 family)
MMLQSQMHHYSNDIFCKDLFLMGFFFNIIRKLFGQKSKFRPGDQVQLDAGGPLMIVLQVETNPKTIEAIVHCKWYDNETKSTRTNLFYESQLKPFDWSNP